ncbi:hypothetical protein L210DRAFT_3544669, partial [Boletus edulis BED1]
MWPETSIASVDPNPSSQSAAAVFFLVHANLALGDPPLACGLEPRKIHSVLYAKQGDLWRRIANTRWPLHCSSPGLDFSGERALAGQVRIVWFVYCVLHLSSACHSIAPVVPKPREKYIIYKTQRA